MAGKSNRGKNRKVLQENTVNSSVPAVSSDSPADDSSSASHANGNESLSEVIDTKAEVKEEDNASENPPVKQGGINSLTRLRKSYLRLHLRRPHTPPPFEKHQVASIPSPASSSLLNLNVNLQDFLNYCDLIAARNSTAVPTEHIALTSAPALSGVEISAAHKSSDATAEHTAHTINTADHTALCNKSNFAAIDVVAPRYSVAIKPAHLAHTWNSNFFGVDCCIRPEFSGVDAPVTKSNFAAINVAAPRNSTAFEPALFAHTCNANFSGVDRCIRSDFSVVDASIAHCNPVFSNVDCGNKSNSAAIDVAAPRNSAASKSALFAHTCNSIFSGVNCCNKSDFSGVDASIAHNSAAVIADRMPPFVLWSSSIAPQFGSHILQVERRHPPTVGLLPTPSGTVNAADFGPIACSRLGW